MEQIFASIVGCLCCAFKHLKLEETNMRNTSGIFGWTALRVSALALGLVAFTGTGFAQKSKIPQKPMEANQEKDDGMAMDAEGGGLKNNAGKMTTGSGAMGQQKVQKKSSSKSKSSAMDSVPTAASHEKDDGMAKDAEGGGLKRNR
jgi:hypothetical protein